MGTKAYVLIDPVHGKSEQVIETLRSKPGVVAVDYVEGPPNVIMMIRATQRQELVKLAIDALLSVEGLTEGVKCLPVIEEGIPGSENQVVGREL